MTTDAELSIRYASLNDRSVIEAMMEAYLQELGLCGPYPYLEKYWQEPRRSPYLLFSREQAIGFALVDAPDQGATELVEFYVQPSFRGQGIGRRAACMLFSTHAGTWRVGVRKDNELGQRFWKTVLDGRPSVALTENFSPPGLIYQFMRERAGRGGA